CCSFSAGGWGGADSAAVARGASRNTRTGCGGFGSAGTGRRPASGGRRHPAGTIAVYRGRLLQQGTNMADLTLYHASPSRSSIVLWMLEEIGQPYDIKLLRLSEGQQLKPDYLAVNPMGK